MKRLAILCAGFALCTAPLVASAQTVGSTISLNASFLTQLQTLEDEVASLEATLESLISSVTGAAASASSANATTNSQAGTSLLPGSFFAPTIASTPSAYGTSVASQLLQAIAPTASATSTFTPSASSGQTTGSGDSTSQNSSTIATQLSPSCISNLISAGSECGGLYSCGSGSNQYWSTVACTN